jgi:ubiquinone/menaquinone biosynthesis C-methylase UbiE
MRKIVNRIEALDGLGDLMGRVVIDVGCGTGDLVRELVSRGARAIGIDSAEMLAKAKALPAVTGEEFRIGSAVSLPFDGNFADAVTFFASLHHVPVEGMGDALNETRRILKPGGRGVFLEPVLRPGSYFELSGLIEDEREVQKSAYLALKRAVDFGLREVDETMLYFERSLDYYADQLGVFVDDETRRAQILAQAREKTERFARTAGVTPRDFRFQSLCRVNILEKAHSPSD